MRISKFARYGALTQTFHWITALLVLAAFVLGPDGSDHDAHSAGEMLGRQLHESIGVCVFVLTALRLTWRSIIPRPQLPQLTPKMALASKVVQSCLYILLFALPITAIMGVWLEGHSLTFLWGIEVAPPFSKSEGLGGRLGDVHGLLGDTIMWIAGVHATAALYHHYLLRDEVLISMLPRWFPLGKGR